MAKVVRTDDWYTYNVYVRKQDILLCAVCVCVAAWGSVIVENVIKKGEKNGQTTR